MRFKLEWRAPSLVHKVPITNYMFSNSTIIEDIYCPSTMEGLDPSLPQKRIFSKKITNTDKN